MTRWPVVALALASCATPTPPRVETVTMAIAKPVPCLARADYDALLGKLPSAIGDMPADTRQREGIEIARLSQYRVFADAVVSVLPGCVAAPLP